MPTYSVTHLIAAALSATVLVPTAVATRPVPVCCAVGLTYGKAPTAELTWPMAPEQPRVRYLGSLSSEADLGKPKGGFSLLRSMITGSQTSIMSVQRPYAAYVDAKQRMYVSDGSRRAVVLFDPGTGKSELIGKSGAGRLAKPMGLAGDANGNLYVADQSGRRVVAFAPDGSFLRAYGGTSVLLNPVGVAVDSTAGIVYVADSYLHQVLAFRQSDATLIRRLGRNVGDLEAKKRATGLNAQSAAIHGEPKTVAEKQIVASDIRATEVMGHSPTDNLEPRDLTENRGGKPGEFRYPSFLAVGGDGTLYVSDGMNARVQTFDRKGTFIRQIGGAGQTPGHFARPKGVAVDRAGQVYVADAAFNNIQIFDASGRLLLVVGDMGNGDGQLWLPLGLHIDAHDRVYAADRYNNRVQMYQYLGSDLRSGAPGADAVTTQRAP